MHAHLQALSEELETEMFYNHIYPLFILAAFGDATKLTVVEGNSMLWRTVDNRQTGRLSCTVMALSSTHDIRRRHVVPGVIIINQLVLSPPPIPIKTSRILTPYRVYRWPWDRQIRVPHPPLFACRTCAEYRCPRANTPTVCGSAEYSAQG